MEGLQERTLIEQEVRHLKECFEKDVGSLYEENLQRKVFLQFRVFAQMQRLATHRNELSEQFYAKGLLEKTLSAWKIIGPELADDTQIMEKYFWLLARKGLIRRKEALLRNRIKFKFFLEWQRALFYQLKISKLLNRNNAAIKEEAFTKFLNNLAHHKWARKTIQLRAQKSQKLNFFALQGFISLTQMERGVPPAQTISECQGLYAQKTRYSFSTGITFQSTQKILAHEKRFVEKKISKTQDQQSKTLDISLAQDSSPDFDQRWAAGLAIYAVLEKKISLYSSQKCGLEIESYQNQFYIAEQLLSSKRGITQFWRDRARVIAFRNNHRAWRLKQFGKRAFRALKNSALSAQSWRVKMQYLGQMRLASYWMAWRKYRAQTKKYKKIFYALMVRKGYKIFKNWRSLAPRMRVSRMLKERAYSHRITRLFQRFKNAVLRQMRDKFIILTVSRLRFQRLATKSLYGLVQFCQKARECNTMAKIMEERFMENRARRILNKWRAASWIRQRVSTFVEVLETLNFKRQASYFFVALSSWSNQELNRQALAEQWHSRIYQERGLRALQRSADLRRRGDVIASAVQLRLKSQNFMNWRVAMNYLTNQKDEIQRSVVLSPQSFYSFNFGHLAGGEWNQHFAEAKAEEWKRQKTLRICFKLIQLEARNNLLCSLFLAKLQRPIDSATLRLTFNSLKQTQQRPVSTETWFRKWLSFTKRSQHAKLVAQYYRVKYLRKGLNKLRLLRIIKEKRQSVLRPVFIQLRIYTLRSLNLKTFTRYRNQEIIQTHFMHWLQLGKRQNDYQKTAATRLACILSGKLKKAFRDLARYQEDIIPFQEMSLQEQLLSPEFGSYLRREEELEEREPEVQLEEEDEGEEEVKEEG